MTRGTNDPFPYTSPSICCHCVFIHLFRQSIEACLQSKSLLYPSNPLLSLQQPKGIYVWTKNHKNPPLSIQGSCKFVVLIIFFHSILPSCDRVSPVLRSQPHNSVLTDPYSDSLPWVQTHHFQLRSKPNTVSTKPMRRVASITSARFHCRLALATDTILRDRWWCWFWARCRSRSSPWWCWSLAHFIFGCRIYTVMIEEPEYQYWQRLKTLCCLNIRTGGVWCLLATPMGCARCAVTKGTSISTSRKYGTLIGNKTRDSML
jgi:hypothetical protein